MAKLDCQGKLLELDLARMEVQMAISDLLEAVPYLADNLKDAAAKIGDVGVVSNLERQLGKFSLKMDILKLSLDGWEKMAKDFRKEVLDAIVDRTKRDKNQKELATTCVPVKDYVEASESELKSGRSLLGAMNGFYQVTQAFAKAFRRASM